MEASSPLAAMRPAPPSSFGQGNLFGPPIGAGHLGSGQFNFQRANQEYLKGVRGSSPAASLAADLSQNFKLNDARSVLPPDLNLQAVPVTYMRSAMQQPHVPDSAPCPVHDDHHDGYRGSW